MNPFAGHTAHCAENAGPNPEPERCLCARGEMSFDGDRFQACPLCPPEKPGALVGWAPCRCYMCGHEWATRPPPTISTPSTNFVGVLDALANPGPMDYFDYRPRPRANVIARLVGHGDDVTATPREREIAAKLRALGAKMEREGYLPELRRRHMTRVMGEEINQ